MPELKIPEGWLLISKKRLESIKEKSSFIGEETYQGRGLYDDYAIRRNERTALALLEEIYFDCQMVEKDDMEELG